MAKYSGTYSGEFNDVYNTIKNGILGSSFSASLEDEECFEMDGVHIGILVFERYSYSGNNRLSLNVTIAEANHVVKIVGVSAGGSQGVIFKFNTFGEHSFLDKLIEILDKFPKYNE